METLINKYKSYLVEEEKSVSTIEKYIRDVLNFSIWLGERVIDKSVVKGGII